MTRARLPAALLLAGAALQPLLVHAQCAADGALRGRIDQLARTAGQQVPATVERIDGTGRRLLALRSYLRAATSLAERWSWSQAEIDAFAVSDERAALLTEIEAIRARFEAANPGYQLYANTDVRSLDQQLKRWNSNDTIEALAADLEHAACERGAAGSTGALEDLLDAWVPEHPAPLAAPGLSAHGRARAIDFQVHQGDRVIAGPDTSKAAADWIAAGWAKKLATAIEAASDKFEGPLTQPNEPWHFEYRPEK